MCVLDAKCSTTALRYVLTTVPKPAILKKYLLRGRGTAVQTLAAGPEVVTMRRDSLAIAWLMAVVLAALCIPRSAWCQVQIDISFV